MTSFTTPVCEGKITTLKEYAMLCARAFGAYASFRDVGISEAVPDVIKVSDETIKYHTEAIEKAKQEIEEFETAPIEYWQNKINEYNTLRAKELEAERAERLIYRKRYENLIEQVHAWTPPTPEHENLKKFMLEQLEMSLKDDCNEESLSYLYAATDLNPEEYRKQALELAHRDIEYHQGRLDTSYKVCNEKTEWIQQLKQSLEGEPVHA